jgi:hypothetical protein
MDKFLPGTQIACVPSHVDRSKPNWILHPSVEYGFVMSQTPTGNCYCRYFYREPREKLLRTVANSELTPIEHLVLLETRPQEDVDLLLLLCFTVQE